MVTTRTIRAELEMPIYDYAKAKGLTVAYENIELEAQKTAYLEPKLIPAKTAFDTFAGDKQQGVFNINIYTPQGKSTFDADDLAEDIIALYPVGKLEHITIDQPTYRSQGIQINGWYAITITVNYRS